ncbi:MAG: hypothetical protein Fur0025_15090 [Oscillatoriaceae cyanobacterium]
MVAMQAKNVFGGRRAMGDQTKGAGSGRKPNTDGEQIGYNQYTRIAVGKKREVVAAKG